MLLVYFSENINELAAENWQSFSRQQYFDSNGLFISTVFSIPILLNCMLMIVSLFIAHRSQFLTSNRTEPESIIKCLFFFLCLFLSIIAGKLVVQFNAGYDTIEDGSIEGAHQTNIK